MADTSFRSVDVTRVRGSEQIRAADCAAAKEPLEVRLHEALPLSDRVLFVSGRGSFEIVQKAFSPASPC